jgi:hypothetical protein
MLMGRSDAVGVGQRAARSGRILENEAVISVVSTIGLMLFIIFLALRAFPHFVRSAVSRLARRDANPANAR